MTSNDAAAPTVSSPVARSKMAGFGAGAAVGLLGRLVGLGGAEFRLPLLPTIFGFAALAAVIVNKAMSLVVVIAAIPARMAAVPLTDVVGEWGAVVNLLTGSLLGAWWVPRGRPGWPQRPSTGCSRDCWCSSPSCSPPNGSGPSRPRTWQSRSSWSREYPGHPPSTAQR